MKLSKTILVSLLIFLGTFVNVSLVEAMSSSSGTLTHKMKTRFIRILQNCNRAKSALDIHQIDNPSPLDKKLYKQAKNAAKKCQAAIRYFLHNNPPQPTLVFLMKTKLFAWPDTQVFRLLYEAQLLSLLRQRLLAIPLKQLSHTSLLFLWFVAEPQSVRKQLSLRKVSILHALKEFIRKRVYVNVRSLRKLLQAAYIPPSKQIDTWFFYWKSSCAPIALLSIQSIMENVEDGKLSFSGGNSRWVAKLIQGKPRYIQLLSSLLRTTDCQSTLLFDALVSLSITSTSRRWLLPVLKSRLPLHRNMAAVAIAKTGKVNVQHACKVVPRRCVLVMFWYCKLLPASTHQKGACLDYRRYHSTVVGYGKEHNLILELQAVGDFNNDGRLDWLYRGGYAVSRSASRLLLMGSANGCQIKVEESHMRSRRTGKAYGKKSIGYTVRRSQKKAVSFSSHKAFEKHLKRIKCLAFVTSCASKK